jgi:hypothetical protein
MFPILGAAISYLAYDDRGLSSAVSWQIGIATSIISFVLLVLIYFRYRGTNALMACGMVLLIGVFSIYYFFGIFGYFYFFLFSSVNALFRWVGLIFGMGLTGWWTWMTCGNARRTIAATPFVHNAFMENEDGMVYSLQRGMRSFDRFCKEKLPFPAFYMYIVYGITPFGLVLNRIISTNFGGNGVLIFVAALGMPVSLWSIGVLVRIYVVMVALPMRIERERHICVLMVA